MGFSPCGVAFAAARHCYSAPCRFYADDHARVNRINWYFVPDDSLIYDGPTIFTPRIDDSDVTNDSLTEPTAVRTRLRRRSDGANLWGTLGLHVDGDPEDFMGQSTRAKFSPHGEPIVNPCGLVRHDDFHLDLMFAGAAIPAAPVVVGHGLRLGLVEAPEVHGLHLGFKDIVPGGVPSDKHGLAMGFTQCDWLDTFNGLNGIHLSAHAPNVGSGYTNVAGVSFWLLRALAATPNAPSALTIAAQDFDPGVVVYQVSMNIDVVNGLHFAFFALQLRTNAVIISIRPVAFSGDVFLKIEDSSTDTGDIFIPLTFNQMNPLVVTDDGFTVTAILNGVSTSFSSSDSSGTSMQIRARGLTTPYFALDDLTVTAP